MDHGPVCFQFSTNSSEKNRAMAAKYRDIVDPDACPPTDTSLGPLPFHRPWKLHYGLNRSMLFSTNFLPADSRGSSLSDHLDY
jgi:hypothetical protein